MTSYNIVVFAGMLQGNAPYHTQKSDRDLLRRPLRPRSALYNLPRWPTMMLMTDTGYGRSSEDTSGN